MEKWKWRSGKVSQQSPVLAKGWRKARACCACCPLTSVLWGQPGPAWIITFPATSAGPCGSGRVLCVGKGRSALEPDGEDLPTFSQHLVRGAGDDQENRHAIKVSQMST